MSWKVQNTFRSVYAAKEGLTEMICNYEELSSSGI
jgi:hypothetical protein